LHHRVFGTVKERLQWWGFSFRYQINCDTSRTSTPAIGSTTSGNLKTVTPGAGHRSRGCSKIQVSDHCHPCREQVQRGDDLGNQRQSDLTVHTPKREEYHDGHDVHGDVDQRDREVRRVAQACSIAVTSATSQLASAMRRLTGIFSAGSNSTVSTMARASQPVPNHAPSPPEFSDHSELHPL